MNRLLLIPLVLFVLSCEDKQEKDCAGIEGGGAQVDCAGICEGNSPDIDNDGICDWNDGDSYETVISI